MFIDSSPPYDRSVRYLVGFVGLLLGVAAADDNLDRSKRIGSWAAAAGSADTWTLAANGDKFHITHTENDRKLSEWECNAAGRECATKEAGKPVKVSMWFNGSKLVVMETRGTEVLKRRFHASGDGNTLELELIPIVPQGKPELVRLARAPSSH
jgi:hypothetical protein